MCFSFHVYAYFAKTLRYTWIPLESFAFNANLFIWTQLCFRDMYVCLLCCQYIHIPWNINLVVIIKICNDFHVFMLWRNIELYCHFHDALFHTTLVHSLLLNMDFMDTRVFLVPCDLLVFHENFLIYSLVEGFLTSC